MEMNKKNPAGDLALELQEFQKIAEGSEEIGPDSLTKDYMSFLTIICC